MLPSDFDDLDREVLTEMGIDPVQFEVVAREDDINGISDMYKRLPNDRLRFIMSWVFDLGRTQRSCAKVLGKDKKSLYRWIQQIKKTLASS